MIEIIVPTPGESITEVEIGSWLVENGTWVEQDQEIGSIESEKATLEITAPESGILEIGAQPGEVVQVGAVIGKILPGERPEKANKTDDKSVVGEKMRSDQSLEKPTAKNTGDETKAKTASDKQHQVKLTPVAKKVMEEYDMNLEDVLNGIRRITKKDIQLIAQHQETKKTDPDIITPYNRIEDRKRLSLLRRKLGERLVAVKNETAMLTTFNEIDMSAVMELRNEVKIAFQNAHGVKLGFMSFFSLAAARSLMAFPQINSYLDGEESVTFNYADIGIAVQTPKGLMVPVIRDVQRKSLATIEQDIAAIAEKARSNKIALEDLEGGTFSITNGGVFGSLLSTPIINPPQSAILGMHNIVDRPVAINGQVVVRPMMYIALSYDHRMVDGKDSVGFLKNIKDLIENPFMLFDQSGNPKKSLFGL